MGPGLQLSSGLRFRASTGQNIGPVNTGSVNYGAFMPGATQPMESKGAALSPSSPQGLTLWVGVACFAALAIIRYTLPK
jgi:hypothetical protein